jgi:hypothetical protein
MSTKFTFQPLFVDFPGRILVLPVLSVLPFEPFLPILRKKRKVPVIGVPIHAYDWYLSARCGSSLGKPLSGQSSKHATAARKSEYQQVRSL